MGAGSPFLSPLPSQSPICCCKILYTINPFSYFLSSGRTILTTLSFLARIIFQLPDSELILDPIFALLLLAYSLRLPARVVPGLRALAHWPLPHRAGASTPGAGVAGGVIGRRSRRLRSGNCGRRRHAAPFQGDAGGSCARFPADCSAVPGLLVPGTRCDGSFGLKTEYIPD